MPDINVVLPSALQSLAGGQSVLTAPAEAPLTLRKLLETVTGDYPVLARRFRDLETKVAAGQEVLTIQSVAGG